MNTDRQVLSRRAAVTSGLLSGLALGAAQQPAFASYAIYAARQAEWNERTDYGRQPLKNDLLQVEVAKTQYYEQSKAAYERDKAYYSKKAPKKCIGNTAAVTPLLENACVII